MAAIQGVRKAYAIARTHTAIKAHKLAKACIFSRHTNGDMYNCLEMSHASFSLLPMLAFLCSIRHDDEQDCTDSSSDGSSGGGSSDSDGSSEEEEEESGDGDARYRKNPGTLIMARQEAPKFTVSGGNSSGARGLNEVHRHNGQHYVLLLSCFYPPIRRNPARNASCV